ncbi:unnamed protein product, partial [Iphiclides podalirius]
MSIRNVQASLMSLCAWLLVGLSTTAEAATLADAQFSTRCTENVDSSVSEDGATETEKPQLDDVSTEEKFTTDVDIASDEPDVPQDKDIAETQVPSTLPDEPDVPQDEDDTETEVPSTFPAYQTPLKPKQPEFYVDDP